MDSGVQGRALLNCAVDNNNNIYFLDGYSVNSSLPNGPFNIISSFDVLHTENSPLVYEKPTTEFPLIAEYSATFVPKLNSIIYIGGRQSVTILIDISNVRKIINNASSFNLNLVLTLRFGSMISVQKNLFKR